MIISIITVIYLLIAAKIWHELLITDEKDGYTIKPDTEFFRILFCLGWIFVVMFAIITYREWKKEQEQEFRRQVWNNSKDSQE